MFIGQSKPVKSEVDMVPRITSPISDALRIELLKVAALQIEHFGPHLVSCRKDVIKFAWNNLKSEDVMTKHWAYVLVCRFIAAYDTPSKIIFQVMLIFIIIYIIIIM